MEVCGLEAVSEESINQINHATLLSSEELTGFSAKTVKRIFERDYPATSGNTETYKEERIAIICDEIAYDLWLNLNYGSEDELMRMAKSLAWNMP